MFYVFLTPWSNNTIVLPLIGFETDLFKTAYKNNIVVTNKSNLLMTKLELFSKRCYSWSFYWNCCYSGFFNLVYLSRYLTCILFSLVWSFFFGGGVLLRSIMGGNSPETKFLPHRIFGAKISQNLKKQLYLGAAQKIWTTKFSF